MAGQTKMIIITSNEDIIRQFSFNKALNTHIVDLDNDQQKTSTETDDNIIMNLAFLAELSKSNSSNDQVYKRALDSPQYNPTKPAKASRKSGDMTCAICGDYAIGFNYDVLSCASCKAFFRRNANQNSGRIRCLTGRGQCSVAHEVRRKCPKCRLERCLAAGMRKDFILSDEEIQRRRRRLEENRNLTSQRLSISESTIQSVSNSESLSSPSDEIDRLLMDVAKIDADILAQKGAESSGIEDILFGSLSIEDWITIESVKSAFVSSFYCPIVQCTHYMDLTNRGSALISWSEFSNQMALRFIDFFRQINDFQDLILDDRLILIKYNLLPVFPIGKCYNYKQMNDCCSVNSAEADKHRQFFTLFDTSNTIRDSFIQLIHSLVEITEQNPTVLSLLLIILILTPGLSMNEEEPPLNDPLAVNRTQCHYTDLLWNYLVNQWGEIEAYRRFIQLLTLILRLQSSSRTFRVFFRDACVNENTVDKITPLMQSVLHIC